MCRSLDGEPEKKIRPGAAPKNSYSRRVRLMPDLCGQLVITSKTLICRDTGGSVECTQLVSAKNEKIVYQALWRKLCSKREIESRNQKYSSAPVISVCLCSQERLEAELYTYQRLRTCPGILPVLGQVDFTPPRSPKSKAFSENASLRYKQGYCSPYPVADLHSFAYECRLHPSTSKVMKHPTSTFHGPQPKCNLEHVLCVAVGLLRTLVGIQRRGFVHQGISMHNLHVVCNKKGITEILLGDLKYATPYGSPTSHLMHASLPHTPPEIVICNKNQAEYSHMAWSAGVVLWELFTLMPPACLSSIQDFRSAVKMRHSKEFVGPALGATGVYQLDAILKGLLQVNPCNRMELHQALHMCESLLSTLQSPSFPRAMEVVRDCSMADKCFSSLTWLEYHDTAWTFIPRDWERALALAWQLHIPVSRVLHVDCQSRSMDEVH